VGADVATPVYGLDDLPAGLQGSSTMVIRTERASLNGETVDVLAIDTDTFEGGAFWDDSYSSVPISEILATLGAAPPEGAIPAVVANGAAGDGELRTRSGDVDVTIADEIAVFPGTEGDRTLLIVDQDAYLARVASDGVIRGSRILLWSMGVEPATIESELAAEEIGFAYTLSADSALDQLKFAAVVWTFDFLEIYAILAGLIAIGGVFLYVDTRQRARNLSYILARRMGLRRREHITAGVLEIGGLALLGAIAGIIAATAGARSLYSILDPLPGTPPGPRWIGALDLSLIALVTAALVGLVAALLAQRTADEADAQQLLSHNT
jgi:putative ABC transport system permease protein